MKAYKVLLFLAAFFVNHFLFAQVSGNDVRVAYTYKFLQNVSWTVGISGNNFTLGVLSDDDALVNAFKKIESYKIGGKSIEIKKISSVSGLPQTDALFVDEENSADIETVFNAVKGRSTLLISEGTAQKYVMINFINKAGKLSFEVNKANILNAKMTISPQLLLLGGTEIDVAQLYKESQSNLEVEKKKVQSQQREIQQQQALIAKHQKEIEVQQKSIQEQNDLIGKQKEEIGERQKKLDEQKKSLGNLLKNVEEQKTVLEEKTALLEKQQAQIKEQQEVLKTQTQEVAEGKKRVEEQIAEIDKQDSKIREQKLVLLQQGSQITLQQNVLFVAIAFILLILGLAYMTFRSLKIQRRAKKALEVKNATIEKHSILLAQQKESIQTQNEELNQQQEEIMSINDQLQLQKDDLTVKNVAITKSIEYAKNIQRTILPSKDTRLSIIPDSFLIYLPKDIVSGDFFWISEQGNKKIVAVIDCTGHGVPGAFVSLVGHNLLKEIITQKQISDPAEIMDLLGAGVKSILGQQKQKSKNISDGMDLGICVWDQSEKETVKVTYSGSKHKLFYVHEGKVEKLMSDRISIGGSSVLGKQEKSFLNQIIELKKGSMLYLATDGFADQANEERARFGSNNLADLFEKIHQQDTVRQKEELLEVLAKHQGETAQRDDITLLGVRV